MNKKYICIDLFNHSKGYPVKDRRERYLIGIDALRNRYAS